MLLCVGVEYGYISCVCVEYAVYMLIQVSKTNNGICIVLSCPRETNILGLPCLEREMMCALHHLILDVFHLQTEIFSLCLLSKKDIHCLSILPLGYTSQLKIPIHNSHEVAIKLSDTTVPL